MTGKQRSKQKRRTAVDTLLMVNDAAKILRKSEQTVRWYEKEGKLAAIRTAGGRRLFKESDVRALAAKLSEQHPAPVESDGQQA
jgi:excisionase family DNA binding protein